MTSVVDTRTSSKVKGTTAPFILVIDRGENLGEAILQCAKDAGIQTASLSGLGALENPVIAYYNLPNKAYESETFPGIYELISLNGNITTSEEGELLLHCHVTLGDQHHQVSGGHFVSGIVGVTAEITIIPLQGVVRRMFNCDIGLKLITA